MPTTASRDATMQTTLVHHFNAYAKNVNSQYGEDGIAQEILRRVNSLREAGSRYCVEFGAWDGKYLSNTFDLISNHGYQAVLIEADPARFKELSENLPQPSVVKINKFVTFDGDTTLDGLLSTTSIPIEFDFLSIDIDGNDYHILESLKQYRPILICIECNPTIPNDVEYIQPRDFSIKRGASARAITALASRKGYAVVASTECNLFLLNRNFVSQVGLFSEPTLEEVRSDAATRVFAFCGYDGTVILSQPLKMNWHRFEVTTQELQVLPSTLRKFPDDYNQFQRARFKLFRALRRWRQRFNA
jgi:hypothetical protein